MTTTQTPPEAEMRTFAKTTVYGKNFLKMEKLGLFKITEHATLKSGAYMDLVVEVLDQDEKYTTISLAHYGKQNGDLMSDPEMVLRVHRESFMVEALTFTNHYVGVYHEVYPTPETVNLRYKKELNSFLGTWLKNLKDQGFKYTP